MARRRDPVPGPRPNPRNLGAWLEVFEKKNVEAARAAGVSDSYISEIISGKKNNPGLFVMLDLARWLGVSVEELMYPPPDPETLRKIRRFSPGTIERLNESKTN
jgi:hypothetical protein